MCFTYGQTPPGPGGHVLNKILVGSATVLLLATLPAALAAQQSCEGNHCSISLGLTATVLNVDVAPAARVTVRPAKSGIEVATLANTPWTVSVSEQGAPADPLFTDSGRTGGGVATVGRGTNGVLVTTFAAR